MIRLIPKNQQGNQIYNQDDNVLDEVDVVANRNSFNNFDNIRNNINRSYPGNGFGTMHVDALQYLIDTGALDNTEVGRQLNISQYKNGALKRNVNKALNDTRNKYYGVYKKYNNEGIDAIKTTDFISVDDAKKITNAVADLANSEIAKNIARKVGYERQLNDFSNAAKGVVDSYIDQQNKTRNYQKYAKDLEISNDGVLAKKKNGTIGFAHGYTRDVQGETLGSDIKHRFQSLTGNAEYMANPYLQWLIKNNSYVANNDQISQNEDLFKRLKYVKSFNSLPLVESGYGAGFNQKKSSSYDYYIDPLTGKYYVKSTPSNFYKNFDKVRTLYDNNPFNDFNDSLDSDFFDFVAGNNKFPDGHITFAGGSGLHAFNSKDLDYWDRYRTSHGGWMQVKEFKPFSVNRIEDFYNGGMKNDKYGKVSYGYIPEFEPWNPPSPVDFSKEITIPTKTKIIPKKPKATPVVVNDTPIIEKVIEQPIIDANKDNFDSRVVEIQPGGSYTDSMGNTIIVSGKPIMIDLDQIKYYNPNGIMIRKNVKLPIDFSTIKNNYGYKRNGELLRKGGLISKRKI